MKISQEIIYKYPIQITDRFCIHLPIESKILSFQFQKDIPCIWVALNEKNPTEDRIFNVIGTGYEFDCSKNRQYIGTAQNNGMVWHLFEEIFMPNGVKFDKGLMNE